MVRKRERHKIANFLEKLEVFFEDVIIAAFAIVALILLLGSFTVFTNANEIINVLVYGGAPTTMAPFALAIIGYLIFPWISVLALMIIARDLWLIRRVIEKATKLEAVLTKELEEVAEEVEKEVKKGKGG